jgi:uncharacterized YccA/Bax inhibitor family protein
MSVGTGHAAAAMVPAYGLLVTRVWLYVTMLRLLALLARNR